MHELQRKLLDLARRQSLKGLSLRTIGDLVDRPNAAQVIQHHLDQLQKKGLLNNNREVVNRGEYAGFLSIPVYGTADCGVATYFADHHIDGYLKVSPSVVKGHNPESLIAIKADGDSMNKALINGKQSIETGDYVIVDTEKKIPEDDQYFVSVIDGVANIKKLRREDNQVVLISESTKDFPPIVIHQEDLPEFSIAGKVIQVVKKPK